MSLLEAVVLEITNGDANLVTSSMVYLEVLRAKHTKKQMKKFELFMLRSNVTILDMHRGVVKKAETIRSKCLKMVPKRSLKSPDAIYAATAIMLKADVLHTSDDDLLELSKTDAVNKLVITYPMPKSGQGVMTETGE